jgi:hypothetical protein
VDLAINAASSIQAIKLRLFRASYSVKISNAGRSVDIIRHRLSSAGHSVQAVQYRMFSTGYLVQKGVQCRQCRAGCLVQAVKMQAAKCGLCRAGCSEQALKCRMSIFP